MIDIVLDRFQGFRTYHAYVVAELNQVTVALIKEREVCATEHCRGALVGICAEALLRFGIYA